MGTFRSCRQKWKFAYGDLLKPRRTARPLAVGTAIHAGLGHCYRHMMAVQTGGRISEAAIEAGLGAGDAPTGDALSTLAVEVMRRSLAIYLQELWDAVTRATSADVVDRIIEESELASAEAESAVVRFAEAFLEEDFRRYKIVAVEQPFHVPLVNAAGHRTSLITASGVWDGVKYDPDVGDFLLDEHKSTSGDAHAAEKKLDMDPQTTGYIYALAEALRRIGPKRSGMPPHEALAWALRNLASGERPLGHRGPMPRVGRVLYNVVRKQGPKEPTVNKDGTVSTAACDTTPAIYRAALGEQFTRLATTGGEPEFLVKARAAFSAKPTTANAERVTKNAARWDELQRRQITRADSLPSSERYVMRHEVFHGSDLVERWRRETFADAALLRRAAAGTHPITRNPEHCNPQGSFSCAYRSLCIDDTPEGRAEFDVRGSVHAEVVEAEAEAAAEEV